jgi:hypothetical protein
VRVQRWLLIILRLLIVIGLLLIIVIVRNMSRANVEGSQLGRSQRGLGVEDGWEDRHVRELKEHLIPLTMNNLLVAPHNLKALIHHIHVLICALACGKDTSKHLQDAIVGVGGRRGTTIVGSARSHRS